jgi:hypothetical protein
MCGIKTSPLQSSSSRPQRAVEIYAFRRVLIGLSAATARMSSFRACLSTLPVARVVMGFGHGGRLGAPQHDITGAASANLRS